MQNESRRVMLSGHSRLGFSRSRSRPLRFQEINDFRIYQQHRTEKDKFGGWQASGNNPAVRQINLKMLVKNTFGNDDFHRLKRFPAFLRHRG